MTSNTSASEPSKYEKVKEEEDIKKYDIHYDVTLFLIYFHLAGIYGAFLCVTEAQWKTLLFTYACNLLTATGIIVGTHRLWSHRSFKATKPLQIFLMLCQSMAFQYTAIHWVRDHRLHHKHSDTNADPHNSRRGFFFSHIGWLLVRKHPEVKKKGLAIDITDLYQNPVLNFQERHSAWLLPTMAFVLPTLVPLLWHENFSVSYHLNMFRYIFMLHSTFLGNSVAHMWGDRPYDQNLKACQSLPVVLLTYGDGYHNYHHAFPHDYRSTEKTCYMLHWMTMFIDICGWLGLAEGMRVASDKTVKRKAMEKGDGSVTWGFMEKTIE